MTAKGGTRPRTRPARSRPGDEEEPDSPDLDDDGVLRIGEDDPDEPRYEVLFRLGGTEYTAQVNPPTSLMLRYLDRMRKWGPNPAISWLIEELAGPEAYEALLTSPKVSAKDYAAICAACVRIVFGESQPAPKSRTRR